MSLIDDDQLFQYSDRAVGKVVLITGSGSGIGKEAALKFASFGAKVIIGDIDIEGAQATVEAIKKLKGEAVFRKCDVTDWSDLVALYELGLKEFGSIDIVIASAGIAVASDGPFTNLDCDVSGVPLPPDLAVLNVNLIGTLYTTRLALHYLPVQRTDPKSLKAIVLMGSIASWHALRNAEIYCATKHAVLGFMRSLYPALLDHRIRISVIHPWFADTGIIPQKVKFMLAGIPLAPVSRVAGAIFYSVTEPNESSNGCAWLLTHDGPVLQVEKEYFKEGVYKVIDERSNKLVKGLNGVAFYTRLIRDLGQLFRVPLFVLCTAVTCTVLYWRA